MRAVALIVPSNCLLCTCEGVLALPCKGADRVAASSGSCVVLRQAQSSRQIQMTAMTALLLCRRPDSAEGEVGGELVAESTGGQISSRLLSMRSANALLELPQVHPWRRRFAEAQLIRYSCTPVLVHLYSCDMPVWMCRQAGLCRPARSCQPC